MKTIVSAILILTLYGCAAQQPNYHASESYQQREEIATSLFASDSTQLSNEAAQQILEGKISIPENSRVALLKLPSDALGLRYYGYNYWRSEDYMDLQQSYVDTLIAQLIQARSVENVVVLPSFISDEKMTLPQMREAAVRMQSNLLVIYKIESDVFENHRLFSKSQAKAFSTCEVAVLDTKTGILPFTNVITKKYLVEALDSDANMSETRKRAEVEANEQCLSEIGSSITDYIDEINY